MTLTTAKAPRITARGLMSKIVFLIVNIFGLGQIVAGSDHLTLPTAKAGGSVNEMKFWGDMSNKEIAETLDMTASNVGVILHRAMGQLREILGRD